MLVAQHTPEGDRCSVACGELITQIRHKWIELRPLGAALALLGELIRPEEAAYGLATQLQLACNHMDTYPLVMQRAHLCIPGMTTSTTRGLQAFPTTSFAQRSCGNGVSAGWLLRRRRHDGFCGWRMRRLNCRDLRLKDALERFTEVLEEMKAVSHLDGCGRATGRPVSIRCCPIAADDRHARMLFQPGGEAVSGAVRKQINRLAAFQIHQDGAKDLAFTQRKVINPQHAWRGRDGEGIVARQAKQGGWANRHTLALRETRARFPTNLKS